MVNEKKCRFLILMLVLSSVLLGVLNLSIGYKVIQQLKGDGWSFLGGLFISAIYIITIPANVFSFFSIRWVREDKKFKAVFPVALGIVGILAGLILHNTVAYWLYIVVFCVLLLIASFICSRKRSQF